jgi:hypothetical protein
MHAQSTYEISEINGGFIKGILRGVRCTKSLRVLFLHRRPPSWTTLVLYSRAVFIFNEPALSQLRRRVPLRTPCFSMNTASHLKAVGRQLLRNKRQASVSPTCQIVGAISKPRLKRAMSRDFCPRRRSGVLDEPYGRLIPLSGVAVQARQSSYIGWNRVHCPSYVSWRAGKSTPLRGLS